ncbi:hypothetical protein Scep_019792 [Stephania cephalantha]|uniref:Uncharacterized protein n=1 Tax=Stephania cephalantha TaxID=152367 RepID=A0AAP0IBJ8_9MAGN
MEVSTPKSIRLLLEQSIASSSFVEVMPHCPLLLCLVGDRSVRQRATPSLLHAVPHAYALLATSESPLLLAGVLTPLAGVWWISAAARHRPQSRATSSPALCPSAVSPQPPPCDRRSPDFVSLEPPFAPRVACEPLSALLVAAPDRLAGASHRRRRRRSGRSILLRARF